MTCFRPALVVAAAVMASAAQPALASAPGLDEVVYGASVEPGVSEIEARYGRLVGDGADGEDALVLEASHGFSKRFYGAGLAIFARDPGGNRRLDAVAFEGIVPLDRIKPLGVDTAVYFELEKPVHDPVNLETKLLMEKRSGHFDTRLNLIAEKPLGRAVPLELRYAASADYEIAEDVRVGAEAFGELGTTSRIASRGQHFVGPSVSTEFAAGEDRKIELRAGYLFAVDRTLSASEGQARVGLSLEFGDHDR